MTPDWVGRQGDTAKPFEFVCTDNDGPYRIDQALAVKFHLSRIPGKSPIINALCFITDDGTEELRGQGQYNWQDADTDDLVGIYYAEIEVTLLDGKIITFPDGNRRYAILQFSRQLA